MVSLKIGLLGGIPKLSGSIFLSLNIFMWQQLRDLETVRAVRERKKKHKTAKEVKDSCLMN